MIRINLMPRAEARRQAARQRDKQIAIMIAVGLVAIIALTEFLTRRDANRTQALADEYQAELAALNKKHTAAIQLERKRKELESKLATIKILERQRTGPVHVLDDLSTATPEALWLTEMREANGSMTILGRGLDNQTIALFMRNLAASRYFTNVDLVETKQVEEGQAKFKEFSIRANVVYAGRALPTATPAAGQPAAGETGDGTDTAPTGEGPAAQEATEPGEALPGALAAPQTARQAAQVSEARQTAQDEAAKLLAEEPRS
ncbi:MAG TPA: PilN domain-containing protein [Candidatus Binatia bacterium]